MLQIQALTYPIGNGITNPMVGICGNKQYVVKTFNNIEGNKVLINEWIAYLIAKKLELTIPNAGLCKIDKNTRIDKNIYDIISDFSDDKCFGTGFYSEYQNPTTVISSKNVISQSSNYKELIPKLMLFDHVIYNTDRNKGNLLINLNKYDRRLILIDHSHIFNLGAIWDKTQLKYKMDEKDYEDDKIMKRNEYLYSKFKTVMNIDMYEMSSTVDYFNSKLNREFITNITKLVPREWENSKEELDALAEYINYRMEHLQDFANMIISYRY